MKFDGEQHEQLCDALIDAFPTYAKLEQKFFYVIRSRMRHRLRICMRLFETKTFPPGWLNKDILPGEQWKMKIRQAINASEFFIACLSTNSVQKRGYLQKEIRGALEL